MVFLCLPPSKCRSLHNFHLTFRDFVERNTAIYLRKLFSPLPNQYSLNVLKLQIRPTYYRLNIRLYIISFLDNRILHHHQAHLQSTDQLQAGLPSDQDCNNTLSPSCSAAVNYLGCRTRLIFPSLSPRGIFINSRALHQIQSGGLVMRSHTGRT